ncbi:hypothetical protein DTO027B5_4110 [Paecilomyces variotii]|nr:hypothetical protein DTO169C6_3435 [Paecilomyces variotii]KAJ9284873.1 hypothetical protein DTO021C3_7506 [Paecilomyces variotii]KAJ9323358.1 hypothetical protein DTO027B3_5708 [Paecilomyces variotii]KAJ9334202.1 hypothetical protein DTO027B5_4110 [Paecilomyces variotii]KAJ9393969.1 hypothetical protein DTO282F9_9105 [Paecilomyces variotii]
MLWTRLLLSGLALASGLVDARAIVEKLGFDFTPNLLAREFLNITSPLKPLESSGITSNPRCNPPCGACGSSCSISSAFKKRSLVDAVVSNTTSAPETTNRLVKRVLPNVQQEEIGRYLTRAISRLKNPYRHRNTNQISLAYATNGDDYTYGVEKEFSDYTESDVLNIGSEQLTGCTVITLVSREAVYMAHIWETLAFIPNWKKDPNDSDIDEDAAFEENCINLLTKKRNRWKAKGTPITPELYAGKTPYLFIMTPRADPDLDDAGNAQVPSFDQQRYPGRIATIVSTIRDRLGEQPTVVFYNYLPPEEEDDPAETSYQGKVLFELDANADGNGRANFRLWYEEATENGWDLGLM